MGYPRYTDEEEAYLLDSYGTVTMMTLMRELGRSEMAIKQKIQQLEGTSDMHKLSGAFSTTALASALRLNQSTVYRWITRRGLPASRPRRKGHAGSYKYAVTAEDFWRWAAKNRDLIRFEHVKRGVLLPEPAWLTEEIRKAQSLPQKRVKRWTPQEDARALSYENQGLHYTEIAKLLKRPPLGVQKRLLRLRHKELKQHQIKGG